MNIKMGRGTDIVTHYTAYNGVSTLLKVARTFSTFFSSEGGIGISLSLPYIFIFLAPNYERRDFYTGLIILEREIPSTPILVMYWTPTWVTWLLEMKHNNHRITY